MAAYATLSPIVVAYGLLSLATGALLLAGVADGEGSSAAGGPIETLLLTALALIQPFWSDDLPLQENLLRIFGTLGFLGWILELGYRRITGNPEVRRRFLELATLRLTALGVGTMVLSCSFLAAMLSVEWAGDPPLVRRIARGGATAFGIGILIFAASVPALITFMGIEAIRGPVVRAIAEGHLPPEMAPDGPGPRDPSS